MTLTNDDLQAIRLVVNDEVGGQLEPIKQKLGIIEKEVKKIKKDTTYIIDVLDRELMHQTKRVDQIENHLHLPPITD
jgi:hypothetical protein